MDPRGLITGRVVDVMTFVRSYVEGNRNMSAFLDSPAYLAAAERGEAKAVGVFTGQFDVRSLTDSNLPEYPTSRRWAARCTRR